MGSSTSTPETPPAFAITPRVDALLAQQLGPHLLANLRRGLPMTPTHAQTLEAITAVLEVVLRIPEWPRMALVATDLIGKGAYVDTPLTQGHDAPSGRRYAIHGIATVQLPEGEIVMTRSFLGIEVHRSQDAWVRVRDTGLHIDQAHAGDLASIFARDEHWPMLAINEGRLSINTWGVPGAAYQLAFEGVAEDLGPEP